MIQYSIIVINVFKSFSDKYASFCGKIMYIIYSFEVWLRGLVK